MNSNWRDNCESQRQQPRLVAALIGVVALVGVAFAAIASLSVGKSSDETLALKSTETSESSRKDSSQNTKSRGGRTPRSEEASMVPNKSPSPTKSAKTVSRKLVTSESHTKPREPAISQNSVGTSGIKVATSAARHDPIRLSATIDTPAANKPKDSGRWLITISIGRYPDDPTTDEPTLPSNAANASGHDEVIAFERFLVDRAKYRPLSKLVDQQASCANIRSAIEAISTRTKPDDSVIVLFRGDVCDVPDDDGEENGGMDEALVPFDGNPRNGRTMIRDDELCKLCSQIDRHVLLLLDVRERVFATSPAALLKKDAFLANEFASSSSAGKSFNAVISICNQPYSDPASPHRLTRSLLRVLESGRPVDCHGLMDLLPKTPHTTVGVFGETLRSIRLSTIDANHTDSALTEK